MPKTPVLTPRTLVRILKQKGFQLDHKTGSHLVFYQPQTKTRAVVPSHSRDLPKGTLLSIIKEAGVTKSELDKLLGR